MNGKMSGARGMAMMIALMILLILSVLVLGIATIGVGHYNQTAYFRNSDTAHYAAKYGLIQTIADIYSNWLTNDTWSPASNAQYSGVLSSANGAYYITFDNSKGYYSTFNVNGSSTVTGYGNVSVPPGYAYIISTGTTNLSSSNISNWNNTNYAYSYFNSLWKPITQRVSIMVKKGGGGGSETGNPPWDYAFFGYDSLTGSSGSAKIYGDAGTNASSTPIRTSIIQAGYDLDVNAGQEKPTVNNPYSSAGSGTINSNISLTPGAYGNISLSGGGSSGYTVTLSTSGDYCFSSIDLQSKGKIAIPAGVTVRVFVTGNLKLTGQSVINANSDPTKCIFYGTSTCNTVHMGGGSNAYYGIYAPDADITTVGGSAMHGAAIGKNGFINGNGDIYYDSRFDSYNDTATTNSSTKIPSIRSWSIIN